MSGSLRRIADFALSLETGCCEARAVAAGLYSGVATDADGPPQVRFELGRAAGGWALWREGVLRLGVGAHWRSMVTLRPPSLAMNRR